jgi:hypothetical protein
MTDDIWEGVCRCRPGAPALCPVCRAAKPTPDQHHERITIMTDAVRDELRLLGMTDEEIDEMARRQMIEGLVAAGADRHKLEAMTDTQLVRWFSAVTR